ncbi:hypothetical protein [Phaeobacter gallaeciensis]|uniref:hypothetical protein n=1 Tax=Phaeobacter gallaeciensis TaxID=60890 RepID=UPI00237F366A|nr:hypothetical protein [Phaeobacter gallaeciensis]MDE4192443.1 hypothetical protein [Phaeobacter gallaeciensis]MDE4201763.1 hypothetical protein [Phaeobacter gallaeciensis]MDE4205243.1 hypothetical protein [Phaeobacter gallaeciensis]MDE4209382.1 hypothetical protein [Phaeobacter gallaeciensis]MDE4217566.1 hypothetical protein [Phaeobacter gallaeciensis]
MREERIAELEQRLGFLEEQNKEYETALKVVRPLLAGRVSDAERQLLLQAVAKKQSPLRAQIWRFLLDEEEPLKQDRLALRR